MTDHQVERQRDHFNSIASRYRDGRADRNHLRIKDLIWEEAFKTLPELRGKHLDVLEAMCGYAEGRDIIARHLTSDFLYHGFDYSDVIVDELRAKGLGENVWRADATTFVPDRSYEVIVLIGGLHHVPHAAPTVVDNLAKGLKPGGIFVNFEPTSGNPLFAKVRDVIYHQNEIFDEETERAFTVGELKAMFTNAGLQQRAILYPGLLAYVLYYNPYAFSVLNIGDERMVERCFGLDRLFLRTSIGRTFSFATLSIWERPCEASNET